MEFHQKIWMPKYQKLKTVVIRRPDQKLRLRNFDARHGRIGREAVVRIRKGIIGLMEEKVLVTSEKKKASVRRETNAVSRMRVTIVRKNQTTMPPHLLNHQMSRGRRVSRKRSIRGKSNHVAILRQPCRYHLKGTCTRSPCEYWHPPECQFYKTETGDKCLFPHDKVDDQPNETLKKSYYSHKRRESDDKNVVAIVKRVPQLTCVSQDSDALVSQRGKSKPRANRCKKKN